MKTKGASIAAAVLILLAGLLSGVLLAQLLPSDALTWSEPPSLSSCAEADSLPLLRRALDTLAAIRSRDYAALSSYVDPEQGVTFTPMSTVDPASNLTFAAGEIAGAASSDQTYIWGTTADAATPISLTIDGYFDAYVWDADYSAASQINVDTVLSSGNALENVQEAYPDCRFVEFYCPGSEAATDWRALKLVFRCTDGSWYLTGVIHSAWTA